MFYHQAMEELGMVTIDKEVAAFRVARNLAKEILESGGDPLKHAKEFEWLSIKAGYPRSIRSVGNLDDEIFIARGNKSEDEIRAWVTNRLKELITAEEIR